MQCSEAINNLNRTIPLRRIGVDLKFVISDSPNKY